MAGPVVGAVAVVCATGVLLGLAKLLKARLLRPIAHISTGEQRRAGFPPDDPSRSGAAAVLGVTDVKIRREVRTLKDGTRFFCQIVTPSERPPTHVYVFLHGYSSHSDMYLENACEFARSGAAVLLPDLPSHGRTDGLLVYVPDWWAFVDRVWEILDAMIPEVRAMGGEKPLGVFAGGISLGGGLLTCLAIQRPTFFEGAVLVCPMLLVADEMQPPAIVKSVTKNIIEPILPSWPIAPVKSMEELEYRVPAQGVKHCQSNPMSMQGLKPRLSTALSFGIVYPDWVKERLEDLKTPFLVQHGTMDKVTDPGLSKQLHAQAAAVDKTIKLYEGAYHGELLHCLPGIGRLIEVEWLPAQVEVTRQCMQDAAAWITARL